MKRYRDANASIRPPADLDARVLAADRSQAFTPRRAVALVTAAALLATAVFAGAILSRRDDLDTPPPIDAGTTGTATPSTTVPLVSMPPVTTSPLTTEAIEGMLPLQLAAVSYPARPAYPTDMNAPGWIDAYDAWRDDRRARRQAVTDDDASSLSDVSLRLMEQFLTATAETAGQNRVISPLNLYLALAMLTETTDTTSRAALLELLGADAVETVRDRAARLFDANYSDDTIGQLRLAASIWLREGFPYRASTIETLAKSHRAASFSGVMGGEAMNDALHSWLNANTGGMLTDQVNGLAFDPRTVLGLATTVYYSSRWAEPFDASKTTDGIFYAATGDVTVPYLNDYRMSQFYYDGEGWGAIKLSLNSGAMWVILPDEGVSPDALLRSADLRTLLSTNGVNYPHTYANLTLSIPRFDVTADLDLVSGLTALGLGDLFSDATADFSPLTDDAALADTLYLSEARHAARVKIDEEGVTGAAYTMMMEAGMGGAPPLEIDFTVDRPFLFAVTTDANSLLFAGIVEQP